MFGEMHVLEWTFVGRIFGGIKGALNVFFPLELCEF